MTINFEIIDLDYGDLNESSFEDDYDQLGLRKASGIVLISIRHNRLSRVPDHLSLNMYGLDISNNYLYHDRFPKRWSENLINFNNLKELIIQHTGLKDLSGLSNAPNCTHIDASNNIIDNISGLEMLQNLTSLRLTNNKISTISSLRTLSMNKKLKFIDLQNNPVTKRSGYRQNIKNICDTLDILDNQAFPSCRKTKSVFNFGYSQQYEVSSSARKLATTKPLLYDNNRENYNNMSTMSVILPENENYHYDHHHEHDCDALNYSFCGSTGNQSLSMISKKSDDAVTVSVFKANKSKTHASARSRDSSLILGTSTLGFGYMNDSHISHATNATNASNKSKNFSNNNNNNNNNK